MDLADHPPHGRYEMNQIVASVRRHVRDHLHQPKTEAYYLKLDQLIEPMVRDLDPNRQSEWP